MVPARNAKLETAKEAFKEDDGKAHGVFATGASSLLVRPNNIIHHARTGRQYKGITSQWSMIYFCSHYPAFVAGPPRLAPLSLEK